MATTQTVMSHDGGKGFILGNGFEVAQENSLLHAESAWLQG
jgi:hypothetical protein